jgi:hypothetical protein
MGKHPEQVCIIDKDIEMVGSKKCFGYIKRVEREV